MTDDSDNPHNMFANSADWIRWEYEHGNGSQYALHAYVKRQTLLHDLSLEPNCVPAVRACLEYLLGKDEQ